MLSNRRSSRNEHDRAKTNLSVTRAFALAGRLAEPVSKRAFTSVENYRSDGEIPLTAVFAIRSLFYCGFGKQSQDGLNLIEIVCIQSADFCRKTHFMLRNRMIKHRVFGH
jgi:hypothetical protein